MNLFFRSSIPDDRALVDDTIVGVRDIEAPLEFRIIKPDGQVKWLQAKRSINRNTVGAVVSTSGVFTDISIRKAAEAEAELQRRELAHLMRVSQVGALSGGLAHELTQPLTAILANAQAARTMLSAKAPKLDDIASLPRRHHLRRSPGRRSHSAPAYLAEER